MVKVGSLHRRFHGKFLNRDENNENRLIEFPGFTRLGFELNGVFMNKNILAAVCWGRQESEFLNTMSEEKQIQILEDIMSKNPPLFILSRNFNHCEKLLHINQTVNDNRTAIIQTNLKTTEIYMLIGSWLSKSLAKWTTIHGTVLKVWGEGVLIIGDPGVGKSETAIELVRFNHLFLGDDAISVARLGNIILAKPNELTKDFIHLRGLGILNIKEMFGGAKIIKETELSMVVQLKQMDPKDPNNPAFENLGEKSTYHEILGVKVPMYTLPVTFGRNMADLIELSVIDMKLKKQGYSSVKDIDSRLMNKTLKKTTQD